MHTPPCSLPASRHHTPLFCQCCLRKKPVNLLGAHQIVEEVSLVNYTRKTDMPTLTLRHGQSAQCSPLRKRYRSYFEITASMLEAMTSCSQTTFTLMKQAGISYKLLKRYLEYLAGSGLIETGISRGRISYRASEKGRNFLRQYRILQEMLLTDDQNSAANLVCDVDHNATTEHNHSPAHLVTEIVRRP